MTQPCGRPCPLVAVTSMFTWPCSKLRQGGIKYVRHRNMCNRVVPAILKMHPPVRKSPAFCLPPHLRWFPSAVRCPLQQGCDFAAALLCETLMCSLQGSRHYMSRRLIVLYIACTACPASFQLLDSCREQRSMFN